MTSENSILVNCRDLGSTSDWSTASGLTQSVERALDGRAGGSGFDSRDRINTQGLKITEKWRYCLCSANGQTFAWLGWPRKMAFSSPVGDVKIVSLISTFVLNALTLKERIFLVFFLVEPHGKFAPTSQTNENVASQKHYPDLGSDTSSVLRSFLKGHFARENQ